MRTSLKLIKITVILAALSFLSCEIKNPVEGVKVLFNANQAETFISIAALNGSTMQPVGLTGGANTMDVSVSGLGSGFINNIMGSAAGSGPIRSAFGIMNFAVSNSFIPSQSNPLNINLTIQVPGFLTSNIPITLTSTGGHSFTCVLTSLTNPGDGIEIVTEPILNVTSSGTSVLKTFSSGSDNISGTGVSLTIPQGTTFLDADENPLTGNFNATIAYFNPTSENALRSFPGSFFVNTDQGRKMFSTAGFAAIEIIQQGTNKKVEKFGKPVQLTITIPSSIKNLDTSAPIKEDDTIPIWSMDSENGTWLAEGTGIVDINNEGKFAITTNITHLSWWNWDWIWGNYCQIGMRLCIDGCFSSVLLVATNLFDGRYIASWWIASTDPCVNMIYVPANYPVRIDAYTHWGGTKIGSINIDDLCGEDLTLVLNQQTGQNVDVVIEGYCPNDPDVVVRPSIDIWIYDFTTGWRYGGYMRNGKVTFKCLKVPNTYIFAVWYDNNWYQEPYDVTQTSYYYSFDFPPDLCN